MTTPITNNTPIITSSEECRSFLVGQGVLPTIAKAEEVYWSLGKDWWKQIIDGSRHELGAMVFDEGLHRGHKEPGYLKGIEDASRYFVSHLNEPFSLETYKEIHHKACAHFAQIEGSEDINGVLCNASNIDEFRSEKGRCSGGPIGKESFVTLSEQRKEIFSVGNALSRTKEAIDEHDNPRSYPPEFLELFKKMNRSLTSETLEAKKQKFQRALLQAQKLFNDLFGAHLTPPEDAQKLSKLLYDEEVKTDKNLYETAKIHNKEVAQCISDASKRIGLEEPFAYTTIGGDNTIYISYERASNLFKFDEIAKKLIENFNQDLNDLQKKTANELLKPVTAEEKEKIKSHYQENALRLIAQLYAELEWAHPWIDGQGRTDLVMLNGLLCQQGLHPCILDQPYFSTSNTIDLWVEYLKKGLEEFEKEKERSSHL